MVLQVGLSPKDAAVCWAQRKSTPSTRFLCHHSPLSLLCTATAPAGQGTGDGGGDGGWIVVNVAAPKRTARDQLI